jgi:HEAT repeat protein
MLSGEVFCMDNEYDENEDAEAFDDYEDYDDLEDFLASQQEPESDDLPFPEVLKALLTDEEVTIHLLYRLSDMTEEEKSRLFEAWLLTPELRRQEITRHLADIVEDNFIVDFEPVFAYCLADPDSMVRAAALDGLWDTTNMSLITPIVELMQNDQSQVVQATAAATLSHYLLLSSWGQLRRVPTERITEALLAVYEDPNSAMPLRRAALEALGSVPTERVQKLIESAYEGSIRELQLGALFAMGNSADPRWLPILLDEMESPYSEMRIEAARASGSVGHSEAVPALAELAYDDDEEVAATAIEALGLIGGEEAHAVLEAMIEEPGAEHLQEIILSALEDIDWLDKELSLLSLSVDDEDEDDDELIEFDDLDE